jgi:hypothetical protein
MIDREEFFREAERLAAGGWISTDEMAQVLLAMAEEDEDSQEHLMLRGARAEVREFMRVKDADGNRIFHNIEVDGSNEWKKEELFDADDYFNLVAYEERQIEKRIQKCMRLQANARMKGIELELRFELDPV